MKVKFPPDVTQAEVDAVLAVLPTLGLRALAVLASAIGQVIATRAEAWFHGPLAHALGARIGHAIVLYARERGRA